MKYLKYVIISLLLLGFTVPQISFAMIASSETSSAIESNEILGESINKENLNAVKDKVAQDLEENIDKAVPIWKVSLNWVNEKILIPIWEWIKKNFFKIIGEEYEERKPIIEQELEKEKQELKDQGEATTRSIWQKFLDLLK